MIDDGRIAEAFQAYAMSEAPEGLRIADSLLAEDWDSHAANFLMAQAAYRAGLPGLSASMYRNVGQIEPTRPEPWNNLSKTAQTLQRYDEAAAHLSRAIALDPNSAESIYNLATVRLQQGRPEEALDLCARTFDLDPSIDGVMREARALANLALGNWQQGWTDYDAALDGDYRLRKVYHGNIEAWRGPKSLNKVSSIAGPATVLPLIVHTEQGIGDEVIFASLLDDLAPLEADLPMILDCDPRTAGLFRRSFQHMTVHGTRRDAEPHWLEPQRYAVSAIASLARFYRLSDDAFPGTPFLTACPTRSYQWKSLLRSGPRRPVIGLAWNGGRENTGRAHKSMPLAALGALDRAFPNALFVSLEYRSAAAEIEAVSRETGMDILEAPWATLTNDYDDTAALVNACDAVVSVMTSVAHLAAGLGVPVHMLLPTQPQPVWRYYRRQRNPVWYKSMTLHRQVTAGDWTAPLDEAIGELKQRFA